VNGEIARHFKFRVAGFLGALGGKDDLRVFLYVEEIGGLQMAIPFGVAGGDRAGVDRGVYLGDGGIGRIGRAINEIRS